MYCIYLQDDAAQIVAAAITSTGLGVQKKRLPAIIGPPSPSHARCSPSQLPSSRDVVVNGFRSGLYNDSTCEVLAGAMDIGHYLVPLIVDLPGGETVDCLVDPSKPMMDLLIEICALVRLNPTDYSLQVFDLDRAAAPGCSLWPVDYKANQSLQSLGVATIGMKLAKKELLKKNRKNAKQPFETTIRVAINFPHGQKYVVRVRPDIALVDLFKMAVEYKNLYPRHHRLCLVTDPDRVLDMNAPLNSYGTTEILVLPIPKVLPTEATMASEMSRESFGNDVSSLNSACASSCTIEPLPNRRSPSSARAWNHTNSNMSKKSGDANDGGGASDQNSSYMPGMKTEKKKGFFAKLIGGKAGKGNISDSKSSAKQQVEVKKRQSMFVSSSSSIATQSPTSVARSRSTLQHQSTTGVITNGTAEFDRSISVNASNGLGTSTAELDQTMLSTSGKKRPAPPPPSQPVVITRPAAPPPPPPNSPPINVDGNSPVSVSLSETAGDNAMDLSFDSPLGRITGSRTDEKEESCEHKEDTESIVNKDLKGRLSKQSSRSSGFEDAQSSMNVSPVNTGEPISIGHPVIDRGEGIRIEAILPEYSGRVVIRSLHSVGKGGGGTGAVGSGKTNGDDNVSEGEEQIIRADIRGKKTKRRAPAPPSIVADLSPSLETSSDGRISLDETTYTLSLDTSNLENSTLTLVDRSYIAVKTEKRSSTTDQLEKGSSISDQSQNRSSMADESERRSSMHSSANDRLSVATSMDDCMAKNNHGKTVSLTVEICDDLDDKYAPSPSPEPVGFSQSDLLNNVQSQPLVLTKATADVDAVPPIQSLRSTRRPSDDTDGLRGVGLRGGDVKKCVAVIRVGDDEYNVHADHSRESGSFPSDRSDSNQSSSHSLSISSNNSRPVQDVDEKRTSDIGIFSNSEKNEHVVQIQDESAIPSYSTVIRPTDRQFGRQTAPMVSKPVQPSYNHEPLRQLDVNNSIVQRSAEDGIFMIGTSHPKQEDDEDHDQEPDYYYKPSVNRDFEKTLNSANISQRVATEMDANNASGSLQSSNTESRGDISKSLALALSTREAANFSERQPASVNVGYPVTTDITLPRNSRRFDYCDETGRDVTGFARAEEAAKKENERMINAERFAEEKSDENIEVQRNVRKSSDLPEDEGVAGTKPDDMPAYASLRDANRKRTSWQPETIFIDRSKIYPAVTQQSARSVDRNSTAVPAPVPLDSTARKSWGTTVYSSLSSDPKFSASVVDNSGVGTNLVAGGIAEVIISRNENTADVKPENIVKSDTQVNFDPAASNGTSSPPSSDERGKILSYIGVETVTSEYNDRTELDSRNASIDGNVSRVKLENVSLGKSQSSNVIGGVSALYKAPAIDTTSNTDKKTLTTAGQFTRGSSDVASRAGRNPLPIHESASFTSSAESAYKPTFWGPRPWGERGQAPETKPKSRPLSYAFETKGKQLEVRNNPARWGMWASDVVADNDLNTRSNLISEQSENHPRPPLTRSTTAPTGGDVEKSISLPPPTLATTQKPVGIDFTELQRSIAKRRESCDQETNVNAAATAAVSSVFNRTSLNRQASDSGPVTKATSFTADVGVNNTTIQLSTDAKGGDVAQKASTIASSSRSLSSNVNGASNHKTSVNKTASNASSESAKYFSIDEIISAKALLRRTSSSTPGVAFDGMDTADQSESQLAVVMTSPEASAPPTGSPSDMLSNGKSASSFPPPPPPLPSSPPPPTVKAATASSKVGGNSLAKHQRSAGAADSREELLKAIRDAAGGQTLRKTNSRNISRDAVRREFC